mmetsp:Transcript_7629/g.23244  ORF Transcript_7629/g.23244 Transcript_7629/m.23244 type:complete len:270 (+) Transcript_7629:74-883(+)
MTAIQPAPAANAPCESRGHSPQRKPYGSAFSAAPLHCATGAGTASGIACCGAGAGDVCDCCCCTALSLWGTGKMGAVRASSASARVCASSTVITSFSSASVMPRGSAPSGIALSHAVAALLPPLTSLLASSSTAYILAHLLAPSAIVFVESAAASRLSAGSSPFEPPVTYASSSSEAASRPGFPCAASSVASNRATLEWQQSAPPTNCSSAFSASLTRIMRSSACSSTKSAQVTSEPPSAASLAAAVTDSERKTFTAASAASSKHPHTR